MNLFNVIATKLLENGDYDEKRHNEKGRDMYNIFFDVIYNSL